MKRFVECRRWDDKWFSRLGPDAKIIWSYLTDNCDHGGLWDCNFDLATFHIGFHRVPREIDWDAIYQELNSGKRAPGAVLRVPGADRWWLVNFVNFQYGPAKLRKIAPHIPVFRALVKGGVWPLFLKYYPDLVMDEFKLEPPIVMEEPIHLAPPPTLEQCRFWRESEGLPDSEVLHFHSYWSSHGWKRGKARIPDPRAAMLDWKMRWIKHEDKKLRPADLQKKIEAINKEIAILGTKQRAKPGTSIAEPDPAAMEAIRELRALKKRYEQQLRGDVESHQPAAAQSGQAAVEAEDPPLS